MVEAKMNMNTTFLPLSTSFFLREWTRKCTKNIISAPNFLVFSYLDFLDNVFCVMYKYLDVLLDGEASPCYCRSNNVKSETGNGISGTLHGRKKKLKEMIDLLEFVENLLNKNKGFEASYDNFKNQKKIGVRRLRNRWSECGCDSCLSWMKIDDPKLHVVVKEASSKAIEEHSKENTNKNIGENVIFIHGIISSSSFWTKTLFPKLSEFEKSNDYNMFAVDILGHGKSPKPEDNLYTLNDHVEWIEKSLISQFELGSFHVVAHSMGSIIALALAAKHSNSVKSVTLVAPPYFPSNDGVEFTVLNRLAPKRLWPPEAFLASVMPWYEHLSRSVCLVLCRNHRTWESLLNRISGAMDPNFMFCLLDMIKITHHSGWHTMHNVLFKGVKEMDKNLESLMKLRKKVHVFMGTQDKSVLPDCGNQMKNKFPEIQVNNIPDVGHRSVLFNRENVFAQDLFRIWGDSNSSLDVQSNCKL